MPGESPEEAMLRVAHGTFTDQIKAYHLAYAMKDRRFFPNSPAIRNIGDPAMPGLPHACFVLGLEDSIKGIFKTLADAALIYQAGGGKGICVSHLRPQGWPVGNRGVSSGGLSFMRVFNEMSESIKQGSTRRGAGMITCSAYWPDAEPFIRMKADLSAMQNYNVSLLVDGDFFEAVDHDMYICQKFPTPDHEPQHEKISYTPGCRHTVKGNHVRAKDLFELAVQMAHTNGEPGFLFQDLANARNPCPDLYTLDTTNPCGEQWLGPYESCVLGSINLERYVTGGIVDYSALQRDVPLFIETLDRMIDVAKYPIPEIEEATKRTRRIGLGVMGWADMLHKLEIAYDSQEALDLAKQVGSFIHQEAVAASEALASAYGPYPACTGKPRRNAAVTSVQPTGTLARLADCSFSIEPVFSLLFESRLRLDKVHPQEITVLQDENRTLAEIIEANNGIVPEYVRTALHISPEAHVRMQAAWQEHFAENAISKTINAPETATLEDAMQSVRLAYSLGCLGWTYYRQNSRANQVLTPVDADCNGVACALPEAA